MVKAILLSAFAVLLVVLAPTRTARGSGDEGCLGWDLSVRESARSDGFFGDSRPVLDRLSKGEPYGQLLSEWLEGGCMRLNYIQVLGTHNSYHVRPRPGLLQFLKALDPVRSQTVEFTHRPLDQQFGQLGIRQVEIDVYSDPSGGMFSLPLGALVFPSDPQNPVALTPELLTPGLKVMHYPDVDFETTCRTFTSCLQTIRAWSDAEPSHLPIMVLVEAKDDVLTVPAGVLPPGLPPLITPLPFSAQALDQIDASIRAVFPADKLITPDAVRGSRATLEEAVLKDGWPTLNESRGRVMFALLNSDQKRADYSNDHPSLRRRVMFTESPPGSPEAAFVEVENPLGQQDYLRQLVRKGYIVRTRADADTLEARSGRTERRESAFASGAQFVSTDYPEPDPTLPTAYFAAIPGGGYFRCNPVLSPPGCGSVEITSLSTVSRIQCASNVNLTFRLSLSPTEADNTEVRLSTSLGKITPSTTTNGGLATASLAIPPHEAGVVVVWVTSANASTKQTLTVSCP